MKRKNAARSALFTSIISLLLCVSMLVGTTFAWFTDEVKSGNNLIAAGNLDIELDYAIFNDDGTVKEWKTVSDATNLFTNNLWEPGHTEVVYLKMSNKGTLALKYNLGINVASETDGTNVAGKIFKLSDHIYMGIAKDAQPSFTTREAAITAAKAGENGIIGAGYTKPGKMLRGADDEFLAVVVYMPEEVGNEANYKTGTARPEINLGINLFATQIENEVDSFGPDYDAGATWTGNIPTEIPDTLKVTPSADGKTGTITINTPEDLVYLTKLSSEWVKRYSNGNGKSYSDFAEVNGGKGTAYYYDWTWTVELAANLDMNNIPMQPIDITRWGVFNGNDHIISNVVINAPSAEYAGLFHVTTNSVKNLKMNNVTVTGGGNAGAVVGYCKSSMDNVHVSNATVNGVKYVGAIAGKAEGGITNSSVNKATVTATGKTVGGLVGYTLGDTTGNSVTNATVKGAYNVGGLLGQAQDKTVANNSVKDSALISTSELPSGADATENRTGEVVARNYGASVSSNTAENVICMDQIVDGLYKNGNTYHVEKAAGLSYLSAKSLTGNNGTAEAVTIELKADIDMGGKEFSAMIAQRGDTMTFKGNGHTISNVKIVSGAEDNTSGQASMFYCFPNSTLNVSGLTLKDVTVNADADGTGYAAAVIGYCEGNVILDNVDVKNATVTGVKSSGMLIGHLSGSVNAVNCDLVGTVTLADFSEEPDGHYAGTYFGTVAGSAVLEGCSVNATVNGNLKDGNDGTNYGRMTSAGSLDIK